MVNEGKKRACPTNNEQMAADDFLTIRQQLVIHTAASAETMRGTITKIEPAFLAVELLLTAGTSPPVLQSGDPLNVSIAARQCIYRFESIFQSRDSDPSPIWYINKPDLLERQQQQRRFVRVAAPLPARVRLPNSRGGLRNPQETVTIDISGGGLCFVAKEPVPLKSRIGLSVANLPGIGEINTTADVVRCTPVSVLAGRIYHIGVSIEKSISTGLQDKLIRSIFALQRKYLANGMAALQP